MSRAVGRTPALVGLAVAGALAACFAPGGGAVAPNTMPGSAAMPPPPAPAPRADGRWELARPGEPPLVLEVRGDVIVIERGEPGVASEVLARQGGEGAFEAQDDGGVKADVEGGASCVEVVAVEGDALVVRIGKMIDDRCVLSDETLRLARQIQR